MKVNLKEIQVGDVFSDECQRLLTSMKFYTAIKISCHSAQAFEPAMESGFKFCSRRDDHFYATQRIEGFYESCEHNLPAQSIIQALYEIAPEFGIVIGMNEIGRAHV